MSGDAEKVTVVVRLKREVLDAEGQAILKVLRRLGYSAVKDVRVAKMFELVLELPQGEAKEVAEELASKILANPVMHDYQVMGGAS